MEVVYAGTLSTSERFCQVFRDGIVERFIVYGPMFTEEALGTRHEDFVESCFQRVYSNCPVLVGFHAECYRLLGTSCSNCFTL